MTEASGGESRMKGMLEHVAKQLVDDPSAVVVTEELDGDFIKLHLQVAESDVGKVIGRKGTTIQAIRSLVQVGGAKAGRRCSVDLIED